jgi:hypothetical protein
MVADRSNHYSPNLLCRNVISTTEFLSYDGAVVKAHAQDKIPSMVSPKTGAEYAPFPVREIARRIQILESSGGKYDSCHKYGKHNSYGYSPGLCLASDQDVEVLVEKWFEQHLKTRSLEECLKLYSGNSPNYFNKFNLIK